MDVTKKKRALDLISDFADAAFSEAYGEETYRVILAMPKKTPDGNAMAAAMCGSNMSEKALVACLRFFAAAIEERIEAEEESKSAVAH